MNTNVTNVPDRTFRKKQTCRLAKKFRTRRITDAPAIVLAHCRFHQFSYLVGSNPFVRTFLAGLIAIFCGLPLFAPAQEHRELDSLEHLLGGTVPDTVRISILDDLASGWVDIDPQRSIHFAELQLQLARKTGNKKNEAFAYLNLGNGNLNLADYKTALEDYIKALHLQESLNNPVGIASCSGSIGNVYLDLKKPGEALHYFERALTIFTGLKKQRGAAACLIAIGNVYSDQKDLKKALDYYSRSLKIFREIGDKESEATSLNNISQLYAEMKEYPHALEYVLKARVIDQETGNLYNAALTFYNMAELYYAMDDHANAIDFYQRSLQMGINIKANDRVLSAYKGLAKTYKKMGQFEKALSMHEAAMEVSDTIYNTESSRQMAEMQARFDSEKKEREITLLTKDKEISDLEQERTQADLKKQKLWMYFVIAGLVLMVLLAVFIFRSNRHKQKANRLLEEKNVLIEEKNKEITDSILYAEKIQRAILPAENEFAQLFPESFVLYRPKDIVSGDFYWIASAGNKLFYATVDCTGHGVPGGFMSMLGNSLLNEIVLEKKITEPGEVLDMLRVKIIMALKQETAVDGVRMQDGMDMNFCCIDTMNHVLHYAAANNPLWLVRGGRLQEFAADKQPVGVTATDIVQFSQREIRLQKGDCIYTFTDGYADQFGGEKGKKFKYKQLEELLLAGAHLDMARQKEALARAMDKWIQGYDQVDDILVIGVRI